MTNKKVLYISDMPADVTINLQDHNYNKLIAAYIPEELLVPGVYTMQIAHDEWCDIYKQGNCNCKPEIIIEHSITQEVVFILRWRT